MPYMILATSTTFHQNITTIVNPEQPYVDTKQQAMAEADRLEQSISNRVTAQDKLDLGYTHYYHYYAVNVQRVYKTVEHENHE